MKMKKIVVSMFAAGILVAPLAHATNGYFAHGYGMKAKGMGGVGIALPQDSLAAATNPAGMVMVGNRIDAGVDWFRPIRGATLTGTAGGFSAGTFDGSATKNFFIPEFGYNHMMSSDMSLGVSVYGNGGMNSDYTRAIPLFNAVNAQGAGVNLEQLFIAPTAAWKITPTQSVGVSLNIAYQRFGAKGGQNFTTTPPSAYPANVINNGYDTSTGYGLHFGWIGQVTDTVSLGAMYQTKTKMSKFDKYRGLFADAGGFDIPATYGVGIAVKAAQGTTVAADIQVIEYGSIPSVANPLSNLTVLGNLMGSPNGLGFGWKNMTVFKIGVSHDWSESLTVRAGYNRNNQQIPSSETMFNILAPGVVQDHVTLGATWNLSKENEVTFSYMHAFKQTVNGAGSIPAAFGGPGEANINMYQDSFGIAYSWKM